MLALDDVRFAYPGMERFRAKWARVRRPETRQSENAPEYRFTFSAMAGEIVAISGESGSGKSTLLDLIAGFLVPASGSIRLDGEELVPLPPERRPVSILFQSENLFDHLSAGRNLALGLPRNVPKAEHATRIEAALAEVGLKGLAARRVSRLSGGQKQRVALARTLLRDRPVLLLDEPFNGLDADTAAAMRTLVREMVGERGWRAVLVSHHEADLALGDRRLRLVDGGLAEA